MPDWAFCPQCATALAPGSETCPGCGAQLGTPTPAGSEAAVTDAADLAAIEAELRETLAPDLQLLEPLGHGGMGAVYLARDPALKRNVVVKVLAPWLAHDATARARFEREAQSAAAVAHPNVVSVFQVGTLPQSGTSYFVMQHVEGRTLDEAFPTGTVVPEGRAARIIGEVAAALAAAHKRGLVHRDIKPANVMLEAETDRVVVVDFGISAAASPAKKAELGTKLTQQGTSIGTPTYMSPEQAAGEEVTDTSDVYSLGVVAFELLTGRLPFDEATAMALIAAHINKEPPPTASLRPDADPSLAQLVDACLAKDPSRRPSAADIAAALLPAGATQIEWPPPGLEAIHGVAVRYLRGATRFAVFLLFYAFVMVATVGDVTGPSFAILMLLGWVGAIWYAFVLNRATRHLPRGIKAAVRAGYPRQVILDVAVDGTPDTQLLLNRVGPFVRLSQEDVSRIMRHRRVAFILASTFIVIGLLMIVLAAPMRTEDLVLLSPLALLAAELTRFVLLRSERQFRRRHLHRESGRRDVTVGAEVAKQWVRTARKEAQPASARSWGNAMATRMLDGVLALVLAFGLLWSLNFIGIAITLERDPPGSAQAYVRQLREIGPAARIPFPILQLESSFRDAGPPTLSDQAKLVSGAMPTAAQLLLSRVDTLQFRLVRGTNAGQSATIDLRVRDWLQSWRRLSSPDLPVFWYRETRRRITWQRRPTVGGLPPWDQRNVFKPSATLQAATAVSAVDAGAWDSAVAYTAELVGIARNLMRDPATAHAALAVLDRIEALLDVLQKLPRGRSLAADAAVLEGYRTAVAPAVRTVAGPVAWKAAVLPSVAESLFVVLAADTTIQPVFRRALAQASMLGFCYSGEELFFGQTDDRTRLVDTVLAQLDDLPGTPVLADFLRDVDWDAPSRGVSGLGQRALAVLFWSFPRIVKCDRLGLPVDRDE